MLTIKQITDNTDAVIRGLEKKTQYPNNLR